MRVFKIPTQLNREEKTFGGVLTIRQVVYILSALTVAVIAYFLLKILNIHYAVCFIFSLPIFLFGLALAFVKIEDITLDKFLFFLIRYYRRPRKYILRGDD